MNKSFAPTIVLSLALGGCHGTALEGACRWLGACTQADPPAERIVILCDHSAGSSCSGSNLDSAITAALRHSVDRPGSRVELWVLGSDVASTHMIASFTITRPQRNGVRAMLAHHASQSNAARSLFRREIDPYLRSRPPSKSPLVSAFAKMSLPGPDSKPSHIIAVTDSLEFGSGWDFECSPPRDTALFRQEIQSRGILPPSSLNGATITFAFVTLARIDGDRCAVKIGRVRSIRELWASVLTAAGADSVDFQSGPPQLETLRGFHNFLPEQGEHP